jgi:hypothetical protein
MSRELKPGDLAMVRLDPQTEIRVFWNGQHWRGVKGVFYDLHVSARPLVVIDPEDREEVERLCAYFLMGNEGTAIGNVTDLQAALREFADPSIEEPRGLGAVVEDAVGRKWVRHDNTPGSFPWVRAGHGIEAWSNINVARVLSMGVTA